MKLIKKIALIVLTVSAVLALHCKASAQTNAPSPLPPFASEKNWVAIPFAKYDTKSHSTGYGGALLYQVNNNFWTGVRYDYINHYKSTAGVQGQIQITKTIAGVAFTPFFETSVGTGSSSLYGTAGPGLMLNLYSADIKSAHLNVGIIGDYEHVVNGNQSSTQVNAGPMINLSF